MAGKQAHHHPNYDKRIKTVQDQLKKLQRQVRELEKKFKTHDHPHTHHH